MSVVLIKIPCFGIPCLEPIWDGNESTLEETNRLPGPLVVQDGDTSTPVKIHPNLVLTSEAASLMLHQASAHHISINASVQDSKNMDLYTYYSLFKMTIKHFIH